MGTSDGDRERLIAELWRRAAAGQLTADELADRVRRVDSARTMAGLEGVLLDLPGATTATTAAARPWALPGAVTEAGTAPVVPEAPPAPLAAPLAAPAPAAPATPPLAGGRRAGRWWEDVNVVVAVLVTGLTALGAVTLLSLHPDRTGERSSGTLTRPVTSAPPPSTAPATTSTASTTATLPATATGPPYQGWIDRRVGEEVPVGLVTAEAFGLCAWERQHVAPDGTATEIAHGVTPHPIVEVLATDDVVRSNGCGPWVPYVPPASPATTVGDGDWLVGGDLVAGRYQAAALPGDRFDCYWERDDGFLYDFGGATESNIVDHRTVVVLGDGERFTSKGCGPWTPAP